MRTPNEDDGKCAQLFLGGASFGGRKRASKEISRETSTGGGSDGTILICVSQYVSGDTWNESKQVSKWQDICVPSSDPPCFPAAIICEMIAPKIKAGQLQGD